MKAEKFRTVTERRDIMKQVHRRRTAGRGFYIIDGTPPGPSDPIFVEVQPLPDFSCATGPVTARRPARHCRARNW